MPVVEELETGILVRTPCQELAVVLNASTLDRVHVVLDPGHGGVESGSATADGLSEKDVNLEVAKITEQLLSEQGFVVTLTRYTDIRIPLVTRVEIADTLNASLLVSIHHQGTDPDVPRSDTPGTEVYYQQDSEESKRFAGLLHEEAVATLGQFEIGSWFAGPDAGATYRLDRDTGEDFYGMVRRPETPAVLAEMSFLGNPEEVELLRSPDFLRAEAEAISDAVIRWFTTDDPGSGFVEPSFTLRSSGGGGGTSGCVDPDLGETAEVPAALLEELNAESAGAS
jgi:N-acetylmuramoyl-L-alanine amidase